MLPKRTLLRYLILTLPLRVAHAQVPVQQWQHCLGGSAEDKGYGIQDLPDGGYIIAGSTASADGEVSTALGGVDAWVVRLDATGQLIWERSFGGSAEDVLKGVVLCADGGFALAGYSTSTDGDVVGAHGGKDGWVVKLDSSGDPLWQVALGGSGMDQVYSIAQNANEDFIVCGESASNDGTVPTNSGMWDAWAVLLDNSGAVQWTKVLGGTDNDWFEHVTVLQNNNILLVGTATSLNGDFASNHGCTDVIAVELAPDGSTVWSQCLGDELCQTGQGATDAPNGDLLIAGSTNFSFDDTVSTFSNGAYMAMRLDPAGAMLWERAYPLYHYDVATSITNDEDGGAILFGSCFSQPGTFDFDHSGYDPMAVAIDGNGDLRWRWLWGGTSNWDYGSQLLHTPDGGYAWVGSVWSTNGDVMDPHGGGDAWVMKLAPADVGVPNVDRQRPRVAPDPSNGYFDLYLPEAPLRGQASVIDTRGSVVYPLTGLKAGMNHVDLSELAPGMYHLRMEGRTGSTAISIVIERP